MIQSREAQKFVVLDSHLFLQGSSQDYHLPSLLKFCKGHPSTACRRLSRVKSTIYNLKLFSEHSWTKYFKIVWISCERSLTQSILQPSMQDILRTIDLRSLSSKKVDIPFGSCQVIPFLNILHLHLTGGASLLVLMSSCGWEKMKASRKNATARNRVVRDWCSTVWTNQAEATFVTHATDDLK